MKLTQLFDSSVENGYITGFSDDGIWPGPFQYRLMGFSLPPTDLYPRPYFVHVGRRAKSLGPDRCINNRNIAQIQMEYVRRVFDAFPKKLKFFMSFNGKIYKDLFKFLDYWFYPVTMSKRKSWRFGLGLTVRKQNQSGKTANIRNVIKIIWCDRPVKSLEAYLRNRTYFLCFHTVKETRVDITGNEKLKCTMHDRDVSKKKAINSNDFSDWHVFKIVAML